MMPVLHSTKDLEIVEAPTPTREGIGIFTYTDHFTVFHYGRMPDLIPGKGEAACRMAVFNFALLEDAGVRTHFRRFIAPNRIEFTLARVPDPAAGPPRSDAGTYLVPVQVLFRNELPAGSSVHRRIAAGQLIPAQLGLDTIPAVGETLQHPLIEYATMLDEVNRFIPPRQAQHSAGLSDAQFRTMRETAVTVNDVLTGHARAAGVSHCDGKLEFLVSSGRQLVLADSPGTPDESRLMYHGVHCGKQVLRNWYVRNGFEIPVSTLIAQNVLRNRWPRPVTLPHEFVPIMSDLYRSLAQLWTGENLWDAPDLSTATDAVADRIGR
ncbi:phosphoribosylaminoimidazolesuccinocarboxamide synthase [Nocardia nova]|uniref:phosphoribosylaminoimidazolesuccinocarboxamide synthase n=1 Tax=Nocardia nova TaxID=37330 RepID=UPI0033D3CC87